MRVHGVHESFRSVVGAVVDGHTDQSRDVVSSEERSHPGEEGNGGRRRHGFLLERLGVGEAGVAINRGVRVSVAYALFARVPTATPWSRQPLPSGILPAFSTSG